MAEEPKDTKVFTKFNIVLFIFIPTFSYSFSKYIVPSIWGDFSLGYYVSLYTYSALVQAFAALFALVGMFVIFKIQSIYNRMSDKERMINEFLGRIIKTTALYGSILDLKDIAINPPEYLPDTTKKKLRYLSKEKGWQARFIEIEELQNQKSIVKAKFLKPLSLTILVILLGIGLLPLSQSLRNTPSRELICILNIVLFALWGFIEMAVYVISTLRA